MRHNVPHKEQSNTYNCGPTCLEMLFDFYGIPYEPDKINEMCECAPRAGTDHLKMIEAAQKCGANVEAKENATLDDILEALRSGHPVIVNYFNCKSGVGHFGVVKGVDEAQKALILADPKNGDDYMLTFDHFAKHWHNHAKTTHAWMMYLQNQ